jgi:hypothetical protein
MLKRSNPRYKINLNMMLNAGTFSAIINELAAGVQISSVPTITDVV